MARRVLSSSRTRRTRIVAGIALLGTSALSACVGVAPAPTDTAATTAATPYASALPLEGYVVADALSDGLIERDGAALDSVGVDGVVLSADGASVGATPDDAPTIVAAAHDAGRRVELLVSNFDDTIQDFSPEIATALLGSPTNRTAVIAELVDRAVTGGFDGVQVDLESLDAGDGPGLTDFTSELRTALDAATGSSDVPLQLSMAVMASTDPDGYAAGGYAMSELAPNVDRIVLMAYDQHGPTWSAPGPVGGLDWAGESLSALLDAGLPAAKADLGVAGYGYSWPGDGSDGATVTVEEARRLAQGTARFDDAQGEWTATLDDGTVLWWSDSRSLALRAAIAERTGIHGLALWQLSSADPLT